MNILITGGSAGLGKAATIALAKDKANKVFFTYRNSKDEAEKIKNQFHNTDFIKCDFGIKNEIDDLITRIEDLDIDVLINNAYSGEVTTTHFHRISTDRFEDEFKENIIPTIAITQQAIKLFRRKKFGRIVTVLTSALIDAPPLGSSLYVASKAYLEKLSQLWAIENISYNISSNTISPSFMETSLTSSIDARLTDHARENHALKEFLTVEEAADVIKFLVYASSHLNGQDLALNAGQHIR